MRCYIFVFARVFLSKTIFFICGIDSALEIIICNIIKNLSLLHE